MHDKPEEFERIYRDNRPLVYRFMFWRTRDEMLAQDLTSHVFEKAWRTRGSFTGGSAKAWLYRIARTTLIDYWRRKKEWPDDGSISAKMPSEMPDPAESLDREMEVDDLRKALMKLPAGMYEVIRLRFIEGMSARQTARRLHLTESNVRVIQYRALKKLRSYMQ